MENRIEFRRRRLPSQGVPNCPDCGKKADILLQVVDDALQYFCCSECDQAIVKWQNE